MTGIEFSLIDSIFNWIATYGYFVMIPLMIIEGPFVGFIAGIFASVGLFNPIVVWAVFVASEVVGDTGLFYLARSGSKLLLKVKFFRRSIDRLNTDSESVQNFKAFFKRNVIKIFFFTKIIPIPHLVATAIITASVLRIKYKRFLMGILSGQPFWSAGIVALGYYFGSTVQDLSFVLSTAGVIMTALAVLLFLYYRYAHRWLMEKTGLGVMFGNKYDNNNNT